jgi:isopenicillin-N epimerase
MRMEFELDPQLLYFNAANQSIAPRRVTEALSRYHREYERNPTQGLAAAWGHLWEVQSGLARFLGAEPRDLFLRTNVTAVLNQFLLGIRLPPDAEILAGELEYGAIVNICRLRAQREGIGLRLLRMPGTLPALHKLTASALVDAVVSQFSARTRLVLLSHVLGGIGLRLPIAEIARETRRRGIFLVVDGAYAPGALPIDLSALTDVDFYGCSLYKWMLGPKGTAFGWVAPRHQELLAPSHAGWTTFGSFGPFSAFGGGSRFQETFLMSGCHDFAPFRAIADMLAFWEDLGPEAIRGRMEGLQAWLETEVSDRLGWRRLAPEEPSLRGPILAFRLPDSWKRVGSHVQSRLHEECRVQIGTVELRGQWLAVFSPHVHNTEAEITEMVTRLQGWVP